MARRGSVGSSTMMESLAPASRIASAAASNVGGSVVISCESQKSTTVIVGLDDVIFVIGKSDTEDVFLGSTSVIEGCRGSIPPLSAKRVHLRADIRTRRPGGSMTISLTRVSEDLFAVAKVHITLQDVPQESVTRWLEIEKEVEVSELLHNEIITSNQTMEGGVIDASQDRREERGGENGEMRLNGEGGGGGSEKSRTGDLDLQHADDQIASWPAGSWVGHSGKEGANEKGSRQTKPASGTGSGRSTITSAKKKASARAPAQRREGGEDGMKTPSSLSSKQRGGRQQKGGDEQQMPSLILGGADLSPISHHGSPSGGDVSHASMKMTEGHSFGVTSPGKDRHELSSTSTAARQDANGGSAGGRNHYPRMFDPSTSHIDDVKEGWLSGRARFCLFAICSDVRELKKRLNEKGLEAMSRVEVSDSAVVVGFPFKIRVQGDEDSGRHTEAVGEIDTGDGPALKLQRGRKLILVGIQEVESSGSSVAKKEKEGGGGGAMSDAHSDGRKVSYHVAPLAELMPESLSVDPRLSASMTLASGEGGKNRYLTGSHMSRPLLSCKVPIINPKPCGHATFVGQKVGGPKTPTRLLHVVLSMGEWRYMGTGKNTAGGKVMGGTKGVYAKQHGNAAGENDPNMKLWAMQLRH
uniref:Uncharacterized protein n=1 Tax=Palpitomonas bilix TaxID=652834 RepID=A0A7S3D0C4_9EUKA|mmetsp:Transcript_16316/g.41363  ORF Transcript_16316/g.41363 Transcript_16316/m.41363 type:complete len:640 (+) Transcript_16316:133-2052(+)